MARGYDGYAYRKNGEYLSFDKTKKGLLIGYDMIPLIGLRRMERRLKKSGEIERVNLTVVSDAEQWGCIYDGQPLVDFASYCGGLSSTENRCIASLCGFLSDRLPGLTEKDKNALHHVWWPPSDRRYIRPTQIKHATDLLANNGYGVVRMRFELANA